MDQERTEAGGGAQVATGSAPVTAVAPAAPPPSPAPTGTVITDFGATLFPPLTHGDRGAHMDKWHVVLVGAGGVGARLAPLLVKHLTTGDLLTIIDGDRVEGKNLLRQHFMAEDIGQLKAQVVADRAKLAAPRDGVEVGYLPVFLDAKNITPVIRGLLQHDSQSVELFGEEVQTHPRSLLLITAVDTMAARKQVLVALREQMVRIAYHSPQTTIWIDCGNATASGQAMICGVASRGMWRQRVTGKGLAEVQWGRSGWLEWWQDILPGFLTRDDPAETSQAGCALRLDTQSVLVNAWAALSAATIAIPILAHAGIRTAGVGFSTAGMAHSAPISQHAVSPLGLTGFKWVSRRLA